MSSDSYTTLGIIAGQGQFPIMLAREAARQGQKIVVIAIKGYTSDDMGNHANEIYWFELGEIARMLNKLKESNIKDVALAGRIPHDVLIHYAGFDKLGKGFLAHLIDKKANSVLKMASMVLAKNGISVVDSAKYMKQFIPSKGLLTPARPLTESEEKEIKFGLPIARRVADLDIGLTIVVKNQIVVAVEAMEGTDLTIQRGAELAGDGIVVIKVARPKQDPRWDLPVVGLNTIKIMHKVNAAALAISADKTLFFDLDEAVKFAQESNIAVSAL